jgi:hypothetical protein
MASRPFVDDIFRRPGYRGEGGQGEWIEIFTGSEQVLDPYEKNVQVTYNNPLPIKAIVVDLTAAQANWKMPGVVVQKVKEIYVQKKYRSLIEASQKIQIKGEMYEGWRDNGKMQIREMAGNVLRLYVYIKVV